MRSASSICTRCRPSYAVPIDCYAGDAQARQIFRDIVAMPATITVTEHEVEVNFHRRSHLPIILASGMMDRPVTVPWWKGHTLRLTTSAGPGEPAPR